MKYIVNENMYYFSISNEITLNDELLNSLSCRIFKDLKSMLLYVSNIEGMDYFRYPGTEIVITLIDDEFYFKDCSREYNKINMLMYMSLEYFIYRCGYHYEE